MIVFVVAFLVGIIFCVTSLRFYEMGLLWGDAEFSWVFAC